ncbi:MAG: DUF4493 domain-containing protein [Rikenellaceae bacterium]
MKSMIKKCVVILSALAMVVGCQDESVFYNNYDADSDNGLLSGTSGVDSSSVGYLQITDLQVSVDTSAEELLDSSEQDASTRATSSVEDSYIVTIESTNLKVPVSYEINYSELKLETELGDGYPLYPADYNVTVETELLEVPESAVSVLVSDVGADTGNAKYKGTQSFTIKKGEVTEVNDIVCDLTNIKASVSLSADLKYMFKADADCTGDDLPLRISVVVGNQTYIFKRDDEDIVFFDTYDDSNTMTVSLSGMYNTASGDEDASYAKIEGWKQTITGVTPGQWRKISINILHANEGNVEFEVTVENWVYDEKIDVDILTSYSAIEETIIDPELMPAIKMLNSTDNEITIPTTGTVDALTFEFIPRGDAEINTITVITPGVAQGALITLRPTPTYNPYDEYYVVTEDSSTKKITITATVAGMELLRTLPDGVTGVYYEPKFSVSDSRGYVTTSTFKVSVGEASAPTITWSGHSFDDRHEIYAGIEDYPVVVEIFSETGITGFDLQINSAILVETELTGIGLASQMDLVNPGSCEEGLKALGFPVGDEVSGQTYIEMDITDFIPLLAGLGEGDTDFVLTVTNSGGKSTTVTLKFKVVAK